MSFPRPERCSCFLHPFLQQYIDFLDKSLRPPHLVCSGSLLGTIRQLNLNRRTATGNTIAVDERQSHRIGTGLLEKMNFKWLDSYFKQRLKAYIPNFIERGIEKKVENAIQSIYQ